MENIVNESLNNFNILLGNYEIAEEGMISNVFGNVRERINKFIEFLKDFILKWTKILQAKVAEISKKEFKMTEEHMGLLSQAFQKTAGRDITYKELVLPISNDLNKLVDKINTLKSVDLTNINERLKFVREFDSYIEQMLSDAEVSDINDKSGVIEKNLTDLENIYKACVIEHKKPASEKTVTLSPDKVLSRIKMIQDDINTYRNTINLIGEMGKIAGNLVNSNFNESIASKLSSAINTIVACAMKRLSANQKAFSLELRIYTSFM